MSGSPSFIHSRQLTLPFVLELFKLSEKLQRAASTRDGRRKLLGIGEDLRAILFFSQPSTRTFLSFQSACHLLGVRTSDIRDPSTSSLAKGESFEDTIRTFANYADLIIMRQPDPKGPEKALALLEKSPHSPVVINAGSGPDEHPTQALLDLLTLYRRSGNSADFVKGKTFLFVGDVLRSRTIRSLVPGLILFGPAEVRFCCPEGLGPNESIKGQLRAAKIPFSESESLPDSLKGTDAVYMTRVQDEYDKPKAKKTDISRFSLTKDLVAGMKTNSSILHPLPRRGEIPSMVDADPRAAYWEQEENGLWVRTALIAKLLGRESEIPDLD